MAAYNVTINAAGMRARLAEIEQGGTLRHFTAPTLAQAVALRNVALFAAGYPMQGGPRSIPAGSEHATMTKDGALSIYIARLR